MKPDFLFLSKWKSHLKPFLPKWQQPADENGRGPLLLLQLVAAPWVREVTASPPRHFRPTGP